jgi:protein TonB
MSSRAINRAFIAVAGALLVNAFLLALLPCSADKTSGKADLEAVVPVNLVEIKKHREPPPAKEEKPNEEPAPKELPEVIPNVSIQRRAPDVSKMDMEMPSLSFDINPKLAGGVAVAPPASGPTVFAQPKGKELYEQGEVDQKPVPIVQVKPVYPQRAKRLHMDGKVGVRFLVNENGAVSNIKILDSTPPGVFDDSVANALSSWKFTPGKVAERAVSTWVVTAIEFKFEDL